MLVNKKQLTQWLMALSTIPTPVGLSAEAASQSRSSERGLTLLECLVAIMVIAVTTAVITPPIFVATATRVQNRRTEQALQLAQGEVDRIRVLVERGQHAPTRLPAAVADINNVPPPTGSSGVLQTIRTTACPTGTPYNSQQIPANQARGVDIDGDCNADFWLQSFIGNVGDPTRTGQLNPLSFRMGVRVYTAFPNDPSWSWNNLQTAAAPQRFTTGLGNQRSRPLAVLNTVVNWSDRDFSLCQYHADAGQACN